MLSPSAPPRRKITTKTWSCCGLSEIVRLARAESMPDHSASNVPAEIRIDLRDATIPLVAGSRPPPPSQLHQSCFMSIPLKTGRRQTKRQRFLPASPANRLHQRRIRSLRPPLVRRKERIRDLAQR